MGTFFIGAVIFLTVLGAVGIFLEIVFWRTQIKDIAYLGEDLLKTDPNDLKAWFNNVLPKGHALLPALSRILATDHSPEASVDLIEPDKAYVRFLCGARRYAISVVLLCGIAGTLFSLHAAIPVNGIVNSIEPNGLPGLLKYQENFRQMQPALANAFWPSIFGVIATLLLQAVRFAFLDPAHHKAGRDFVELASSALIPWKLRHREVSYAANDAASKLEGAAKAFANAAQSGADVVTKGSETAKESLDRFGTAASEGCSQLSDAFQNSAEQIGVAGSSAVATIQGSSKEISKVMADLGAALLPIAQRMESVAKTLGTAADRFDKSVASNGPFLKAMEQLYDASSPAEKRYEDLLVAVAKMQELAITQNADLLRLHQETAILAKSATNNAKESTSLARSLQTATASLPATAQAVTNHGDVLTALTRQWQTEVSSLTNEFRSFSTDVKTVAGTQRQAVNELMTQMPTMIAEALAAKLPNELGPLINRATAAAQSTNDLNDGVRSLQTSIDALRKEMSMISIASTSTTSSPSINRKKKWYQLWKR